MTRVLSSQSLCTKTQTEAIGVDVANGGEVQYHLRVHQFLRAAIVALAITIVITVIILIHFVVALFCSCVCTTFWGP